MEDGRQVLVNSFQSAATFIFLGSIFSVLRVYAHRFSAFVRSFFIFTPPNAANVPHAYFVI